MHPKTTNDFEGNSWELIPQTAIPCKMNWSTFLKVQWCVAFPNHCKYMNKFKISFFTSLNSPIFYFNIQNKHPLPALLLNCLFCPIINSNLSFFSLTTGKSFPWKRYYLKNVSFLHDGSFKVKRIPTRLYMYLTLKYVSSPCDNNFHSPKCYLLIAKVISKSLLPNINMTKYCFKCNTKIENDSSLLEIKKTCSNLCSFSVLV